MGAVSIKVTQKSRIVFLIFRLFDLNNIDLCPVALIGVWILDEIGVHVNTELFN